jgi:hypothetical protein
MKICIERLYEDTTNKKLKKRLKKEENKTKFILILLNHCKNNLSVNIY